MDNRSLVHEIITLTVTHRYRVGKATSKLGLYFGQPAILEYILMNNGCTQKELADKINCTDKAVSRWETGRGIPEVSLLLPLSKALDVTVNELLSGEKIEEEKLLENQELFKTPIVRNGKKATLGYCPDEWKKWEEEK